MLQSKDTTFNDFSGGLTGDVRKGFPNQLYELNNMVITPHGSIKTRDGSVPIFNSTSSSRCRGIFTDDDDIFFLRGKNAYVIDPDPEVTTLVPTIDGSVLFNTEVNSTSVKALEWRNHHILCASDRRRPAVLYKDSGGNKKLRSAGIPWFTATQKSSIGISNTCSAGSDSYLFGFTWVYEYTVGDVTFKRYGEMYKKQVTGVNATTGTFSFSALPYVDPVTVASVYGEDSHFDTTNMKLEVYCSIANGISMFLLGSIDNDTSPRTLGPYTITIAQSDAILSRQGAYTNGGGVDRDMPPRCKDIAIVNETAFYLNVEEEFDDGTVEEKPFRIVQSIPGVAPSVNRNFYSDLDEDIVGGGVAGGNLIVFTDSYIYRIDGSIAIDGRGSLRPTLIDKNIGCLSRDSIVSTENGVYFAGRDGFYFTDGVRFTELTSRTKALEQWYRRLTLTSAQYSTINSTYDAKNNRIIWSVKSTTGTSDNDMWVIYDIGHDAFSTADGERFESSSLHYDKEVIYRGDFNGYVYEHKEDYDSDYKKDTSESCINWDRASIVWKAKPVFFTNLNDRLWVRSVNVSAESGRDIGIDVKFELINGRKYTAVPIIYRSSYVWRDINNLWANPTDLWRPSISQTKRRRTPRGASRSRGITVELSAGKTVIQKSDVMGTATLVYKDINNPIELLVTLPGADVNWPNDVVGSTIRFSTSDYLSEHLITARTDSTLTISGGATQPGTDVAWEIYGIPKFQDVEIKSISYKHGVIGNEENKYQTGQEQGND